MVGRKMDEVSMRDHINYLEYRQLAAFENPKRAKIHKLTAPIYGDPLNLCIMSKKLLIIYPNVTS